MIRGLYDFEALNSKTMAFRSDDRMIYISPHPRDKNWLRVANSAGVIGLVPINYIEIDHEYLGERLVTFMDEAIRSARRERLQTLDELMGIRQNLCNSPILLDKRIEEIETEIHHLKSKAISESNNEDEIRSKHPRSKDSRTSSKVDKSTGGSAAHSTYDSWSGGESARSGFSVRSGRSTRSKDSSKSGHSHKSGHHHSRSPGPSELPRAHSKVEVKKKPRAEPPPVHPPTSPTPPAVPVLPVKNGAHETPRLNYSHVAAELIQAVREATELSHEKSQIAVHTVLQQLGSFGGCGIEDIDSILEHLETPCAIRKCPSLIEASHDALKLRTLFIQLANCKNDEQQRSWALHEDEAQIINIIYELNTILKNADHSISIFVMKEEDYNHVGSLVLYYQMETRWSIRSQLLDSFAFMAAIDARALSVLFNSILPMELAREMRVFEKSADRLSLVASLLGVLCSTGESMPITHYDHVGVEFLDFVFQMIENPPNDDEKITDTCINLILAYNLQFKPGDENFTIRALANRDNAKVFTQKAVYLLNWEDDPIAVLNHEPKPPNSICKLMNDIFACAKTADLFYTNDIKVLIDIVTRNITDLGPGDARRRSYLQLIRVVLRNTNFNDHLHRRDDLLKCFTSILLEEDPLAIPDKRLIQDITTEFPVLIK